MRTIALLALASGCATTWITTQATGTAALWDESARNVHVPQPGITEELTVMMPLEIEYEPQEPQTDPHALPPPPKARPFALACSADQAAKDVVYHSAFRYGSFWKKGTAVMFLAEAAIAGVFLLEGNAHPDQPGNYVASGFFAADALVTGVLFFAPREEIYRHDLAPVSTHVRSDCPDGLELAIGDTVVPIDAAGHLGEVGDAALDAWMQAPTAPVEVRFAGKSLPLALGPGEQCTWRRAHDHQACVAQTAARSVTITIEVPPGTLTTYALR
jgi:hypothetical protein